MDKQQPPSWHIGLIGFSYAVWDATLYGGDKRARKSSGRGSHRLTQYAVHFNAVEINSTFYGIPTIDTVQTWADATPPDFRFCVKMPRDVTHGPTSHGAQTAPDNSPSGHLLRDETLATAQRFLEALKPLGSKLGAVLVQFPPKFTASRGDELATFHDRLGRTAPLAVEFRHDSWWSTEIEAILRDCGVCWAGTDDSPQHEAERAPDIRSTDKRTPRPITPTADFLYVRWLGKHSQFDDLTKEHFDPSLRLQWWAQRLREILDQNPQVRTVYGFFDNDFAGHAPATARRFTNLIGLPPPKVVSHKTEEAGLFG